MIMSNTLMKHVVDLDEACLVALEVWVAEMVVGYVYNVKFVSNLVMMQGFTTIVTLFSLCVRPQF